MMWQTENQTGKLTIDNGQLTIIGATNVVYIYPSGKVCRERPMCRSAPERTELLPKKTDTFPHFVIPTVAQAEWRNPPRRIMNQHKIKHVTWEDSSTPFHSARNDIIGRWFRFVYTGYICDVAERHTGRSLR